MPKQQQRRNKRKATRPRAALRIRDGLDPRPATFNKVILSLIVDYDVNFATDVSHGFGFSPSALWVNGVSTTTIVGASEIAACFDMVRIQKVEVTMMPGCNFLGFGANTITTGSRNIPYIYHCVDYNSGDNPSLAAIRQQPTCMTESFDHVIKRTIQPRVSSSGSTGNGVTNMSANPHLFTSVSSDIPAYGFKVYADLFDTALTYDVARFSFKIFYECIMGR